MSPASPQRDASPLLWLGAILALALACLWLAGALSAELFGGGWTAIDLGQMLRTAARLPEHVDDPGAAWPRRARARAPEAPAFYSTLLFVIAAALAIVASVARGWRATHPDGPRGRRPAVASWAKWSDLRPLRVRRTQGRRLTLGRQGGSLIAAEPLQSAIVVAPTQSGKTSGLAVPALLEWSGPVVATSIKTDLLRHTLARRRQLGEVMVYDPTESTRIPGVRATPLSGCHSWRGAMRVANWLASSAQGRHAGLEQADFWYSAAEKLLAPLLYAAAANGLTMADVIRWLDCGPEAQQEVGEQLEAAGTEEALWAWQANLNRDERQRSSIYTTAETIVAAFADPRVLSAASGADYTPARLLDGRSNTLYLCSPAHEQERLRPLFAMMVREIIAVAYEASALSGKPLEPPLLMVLDEAANIAPVPNLDEVASSGAGQGIQLLSVFQDLAQLRKRYGEDRARTIVNNHRAKVFGAGISDPETLDYVRRLVGAGEFRQRSQTAGELGRHSTTEATIYQDLTPATVIREGRPGTALLLYGHLPPARVSLRPWFKDRALRALAGAEERRSTA